ncbi:hypothetical protein [Actinoplanes sp. M2I2]|uniref:hypothetical protein n=1 Tax=Actinoplanes sp. M2I2 TaxID=1734444 RepID=UPI0020228D2A|nr:hypothetical protein [Actinoplanes sp. M2I2]
MHQHMQLHPGEVLHIGGEASVQFAGARALIFRLIRVDPRSTYDGWLWLDGYVLSATGAAVQRRRVFVRQEGLRPAAVNGPG